MSFSVSACLAHQSMLGLAGGMTELHRTAAPQPSVCCWHAAPTTQQLGKPCKEEGTTEVPGNCHVSHRTQTGPVRERRKSRNCQLLHCAETYQPAEEGIVVPDPLQGLGTDWQKQERRWFYFSVASQGSITLLWGL